MVTRVLQIVLLATMRTTSAGIPSAVMKGEKNPEDGHEFIGFPLGSGNWFIRSPGSSEWTK